MQIDVQHHLFKTQRLVVETAGLLGGPRLLLNGALAKRSWGRYKVIADSGVETTIQLKYNYLDPIPKIKIGDDVVELAKSLKWYEYLWISFPIVLIFTGGAIGGLCGGFAANANGRLFRSNHRPIAKYSLSVLITLGAVIAFIILATILRLFVGAPHK